MKVPWLPPGRTQVLSHRGEIFYRHHDLGDTGRPTVLLLHGWTANADTQFFNAYEALAEKYSFVAVDHRGHGRGIRSVFTLEDVADDAAALVRALGVGPVITVGYSMGGPVSMLLADRHPDLVAGLVVQATSLEWRETKLDRAQWGGLWILNSGLRSRLAPRALRRAFGRLTKGFPDVGAWQEWLAGEIRRNDVAAVIEAGHALKRYDARQWAPALDLPAGLLLTTEDQLVRPRKQRALAAALRAEVRELEADHLCTLTHPREYAALTVELVDLVAAKVAAAQSAGDSTADDDGTSALSA